MYDSSSLRFACVSWMMRSACAMFASADTARSIAARSMPGTPLAVGLRSTLRYFFFGASAAFAAAAAAAAAAVAAAASPPAAGSAIGVSPSFPSPEGAGGAAAGAAGASSATSRISTADVTLKMPLMSCSTSTRTFGVSPLRSFGNPPMWYTPSTAGVPAGSAATLSYAAVMEKP